MVEINIDDDIVKGFIEGLGPAHRADISFETFDDDGVFAEDYETIVYYYVDDYKRIKAHTLRFPDLVVDIEDIEVEREWKDKGLIPEDYSFEKAIMDVIRQSIVKEDNANKRYRRRWSRLTKKEKRQERKRVKEFSAEFQRQLTSGLEDFFQRIFTSRYAEGQEIVANRGPSEDPDSVEPVTLCRHTYKEFAITEEEMAVAVAFGSVRD